MNLVEIFKTGTRLDMAGVTRTFTDAHLDQMADTYNPTVHTAPFLVGHDESKPNTGLVGRAVRIGQSLFAEAKDVTEDFKAAINNRRLPALSAALYHPDDKRNPYPGNWALRHVAAVQIAATKGMQPPMFEEGDLSIAIEFSEPAILGDQPMPPTAAELEQREATLAVREAMIDQNEFANFAETLLKDGKQFDKTQATAIFLGLPQTGVIAFSETEKPNPRDAFKTFLKGLPKSVEFGEVSGGTGPTVGEIDVQVVAKRAQQYKAEQSKLGIDVSYSEAVQAVMGDKK